MHSIIIVVYTCNLLTWEQLMYAMGRRVIIADSEVFTNLRNSLQALGMLH